MSTSFTAVQAAQNLKSATRRAKFRFTAVQAAQNKKHERHVQETVFTAVQAAHNVQAAQNFRAAKPHYCVVLTAAQADICQKSGNVTGLFAPEKPYVPTSPTPPSTFAPNPARRNHMLNRCPVDVLDTAT